jgi:hypothetical protein
VSTPEIDPVGGPDPYDFSRIDATLHSEALRHGVDPKHAPAVCSALAQHIAESGARGERSYRRTQPDDPLVGKFFRAHLKAHPEHAAPAAPAPTLKQSGFDV